MERVAKLHIQMNVLNPWRYCYGNRDGSSDCDGRYSFIHYIHRIMAYTLQDKMNNGSIICTVPQAPPT